MRNLGPARLAAMAGMGLALLAFIAFFATRFTTQPMELLYGNLAAGEAKTIIAQLEDQQIPYEMRANGTEIFVPADQQLKLRVQLAEMALPTGASMGYEVFDQQGTLGSTSFMQNVNLLRALEGELARTVRAIDSVQAARVHLVLPKREMFSRETQEPSAAVYVKLNAGSLRSEQITAIQQLVAASVPQLSPQKVSIVDEHGRLLSSGFEDQEQMVAMRQEEMRRDYERTLSDKIVSLLERTVGPGKVQARVSADMDFDRQVIEEEVYDPDGQVVRSTTTREETIASTENDQGAVTVEQNLPDPGLGGNNPTASNNESRIEETVNYEISRRVTNRVKESGIVQRLTVAVMVDGITEPPPADAAEDAQPTYTPRSEEDMEKLGALVRSAIGYDANRGDQVELVNLRFAQLDTGLDDAVPWEFLGFTKEEVMRMAEGLGVAVVAILAILLVVRPLVNRAFETMPATDEHGQRLLTAEGAGAPQLAGPGGMPIPSGMVDEDLEIPEDLIDIDKVEGRVKASSLRKIGEIVDKHPEEALSIIRNWLYQES
ncbi:flagellar M-ring protein FliF [Roseospirillum parvum]|uniref:Flagellar M-ring protein n=2 Tax=Roseospirillum parvum TaxID=83401 RepID=A0A1G7W8T5_9PROT|nr:flagellar M-ring protein FliF [Roseospirillum parvum]